MLIGLTKFFLALLLLTVISFHSLSQQLVPDTSSSPAYKNAVTFYNQSLHEELHIFNGKEDKGYLHKFDEGTPYFITNKWSKGNLNYDGKLYEDVSLLYDVVKDEVGYLYFNNLSEIILSKEKVSAFSVMGHHFVNVTPDSLRTSSIAAGFYDELYHGKTLLLAKRTKNIQNFITQSGEEYKVFSKDHYYVKKGEDYFSVNSKKSFIQNLTDKRKELQQYIRQTKLDFKKNPEVAMSRTLAYYDQLINKQ